MAAQSSLTLEQRQQIIAKLLAERRAKGPSGSHAAGQLASAEDEQQEDRAQRVQQLIRQRAAARQQQGQYHQSPPSSRPAQLQQQASLDDLLSPGSTCSFMSNKQAPCLAHGNSGVQLSHNSSITAAHLGSAVASGAGAGAVAGLDLEQQCSAATIGQQFSTGTIGYQQPGLVALDGPVDVSQLWAARATPSEQLSCDTADADDYATECSSQPSFLEAGISLRQQEKQPTHWRQFQRARSPLHQPQQQLIQQLQKRQPHQQPIQPQQQQRQQQQEQQQQRVPCLKQQQQKHREQQQRQQQQQHRLPSPARERPLPHGYPASRDERIQQLAQPKSANRQKYEQMKLESELEVLQQCSFTPKTGRGPQHQQAHQGLPVAERLYHTHAERQARLQRKAAEQAASTTEGCTFKPQTNKAAHERYLAAYDYVPIHQRLTEVLRSKNEKLAQIQMQVEKEAADVATFTPRINPHSSMLALRRSRAASPGQRLSDACGISDQRGARDSSRGRGLRRARSEADLTPEQQECSFTPRINPNSKAMLQASGEIPAGFLQRQEYFDRLAREKKQLLQLAVEDQHCSFSPTRSMSDFGRSSGSDEPYLDRIERLAYQDRRKMEAARSALAEQVHNSECTFTPAINPRSQRMAEATPLQELYENNKGKMKRGAAALAVEMQHQQECTFAPNLQKPGVHQQSPAEAKLSLSASEVDAAVARLHSHQRNKEDKVEAAMSFKQYQELKQCTFTPEITRSMPKQQGPVLVRGLGRFMELKEMARKQAEQKAAVEAKVFMTQLKPRPQPFTVPQPFRLGRGCPAVAAAQQLRKSQAEALAHEAATRECTFKPQINSNHKSRQQRVKQLLDGAARG